MLRYRYNTAVFSSLSANAYDYIVVDETFLTSSAIYNSSHADILSQGDEVLDMLHEKALNGALVKYDPAACMAEYAVPFVSKVRNVLLVSTDNDPTNNVLQSYFWDAGFEVPFYWICGDGYSPDPYRDKETPCTLSIATSGAATWTVMSHPISYCMVEPVVEECRLSFSLEIMLIVIVANMTKATIMILTYWKLNTPTLVTIGDAIASFLDKPDPTTAGICLSTREDIRKGKWKNEAAKRWVPKRHFWFKAASIKRWLTCNILQVASNQREETLS
jgi:hypothetical protein